MSDAPKGKPDKVVRIYPELSLGPSGDFDEIGALGQVAGELRRAFVVSPILPSELTELRAAIAAAIGQRAGITGAQVESLIALGVIGRVSSGGVDRLVWMRDGAPEAPEATRLVEPAPELVADDEAFRLDIEIDIESERLLLYRVVLVGLLVIGLVIARDIVMSII